MTNRPWQRHYDFDVPTSIRYPRIPIHQLLQASAKAVPNKAALNFFGTEMTYWELRLKILRLANALSELGVQKGDRVGIHLLTCLQFVIASQAASFLGAIVVNLNPMYTVDELKFMVTTTGISTLITFDTGLPNIRSLCQEINIPRIVVTKTTDSMNGFNQSTPAEMEFEEGWHHFSLLIEGCSNTRIPPVDIAPDDPAII